MPPHPSADDYHKLLQKIAVLETKIHRLEVNAEVNRLCGSETTFALIQISGQEHANRKIKSDPWTMEGRITGRAQRAEVSGETGWPAFPPRLSASSTTATRKT